MGLLRAIANAVKETAHYSGWDESGRTHEAIRTGRQASGPRAKTIRSTGIPRGQCPGGCGSRGRAVTATGWCGRRQCKAKAAAALGGA